MSHTKQDLMRLQGQSLTSKIEMTKDRIAQWLKYYDGQAFVSFSGGIDSTVLLDIARQVDPDIKAIYINTGLEVPEVRRFALSFDNVDVLIPKMPFIRVIKKYGYPVLSKETSECVYGARKYLKHVLGQQMDAGGAETKARYPYFFEKLFGIGKYARGGITEDDINYVKQYAIDHGLGSGSSVLRFARVTGLLTKDNQVSTVGERSAFNCKKWEFMINAPFEIAPHCCNINKKGIIHKYIKDTGMKPITGQMASESRLRTEQWLRSGCNGFNLKQPVSNPMAFWVKDDCLLYIALHNLPIASYYGKVVLDDGSEFNSEDFPNVEKLELFDPGRPLLKTTGANRSGCFACGFGAHMEKPEDSRFHALIDFSDPRLADWQLRGGAFNQENGLWQPYQGLGYWFVYEWINQHSNCDIWYPNRDYYLDKYMTDETKYYLNN